jgi:hypothetical protein
VLVLLKEIAEACTGLAETKPDMRVMLVASKLELRRLKGSCFMFNRGGIGLENFGDSGLKT